MYSGQTNIKVSLTLNVHVLDAIFHKILLAFVLQNSFVISDMDPLHKHNLLIYCGKACETCDYFFQL